MSLDITDYLRKLQDNSKLNKLLSDDNTDITMGIDVYSGEYKGSRISFVLDDISYVINTALRNIVIYGETKTNRQLDALLTSALDFEIISKFNLNKLDEDYFEDLKESLELDIENYYNKQAKNYENDLINLLKEYQSKDYDSSILYKEFNRSQINPKSDHVVLSNIKDGTTIKYNTGKNKFTVKNVSSYKNKFSPEDVLKDFDTSKLNDAINKMHYKRNLHLRRLDLDDGMGGSYLTNTVEDYNTDSDLTE